MAKEQAAPRGLRVLVVEECAMFRDAMLRSLSMEPDLDLVLACANPDEAFAVAARNPVDVVVLHDQTGSGSSARFLRGARRHGFTGRALVVTGDVKEPTVRQLIRLGAAGLLLRERRLSDLMESIHAIAAGAGRPAALTGNWCAPCSSRGSGRRKGIQDGFRAANGWCLMRCWRAGQPRRLPAACGPARAL